MGVRIPDLDLDLVRCFLAVAESGGFTAAGRRLNLSQSAVSLKVQRLEALLGRMVLNRTRRSLELTAEGEVLLGYGRRLLSLNQEMIERIADPAAAGPLRLGVMQQFGQQALPELLARFKRAHPGVKLSVEVGMTGELLAAMEQDRFDLVLGAAGFARPGSHAGEEVLMRDKVVWAGARDSEIDPRQNPLPLVLFPAPCGYRRAALERLESIGRSWRIVYSSTSLPAIQAAIQADLGIGVLGRSSLLPGLKPLRQRSDLPALPDTAMVLYHPSSSAGPLAKALGAFFIREIGGKGAGRKG